MSGGVYMILIQSLILSVTCSILMFCASKKQKKGGVKAEKTRGTTTGNMKTAMEGAVETEEKEDEKVKPPRAKSLEGNGLIDENGYILDDKNNEELATLKYLETYKPPQTGQYSEDEIFNMEEREITKRSSIASEIEEMRDAWIEEEQNKNIEKARKKQDEIMKKIQMEKAK